MTTGVISGAFPLYRGGWSTTWSGLRRRIDTSVYGDTEGLDQYYYSSSTFWDSAGIKDPGLPSISESTENPSLPPNPPFRTKGLKIALFKGQRVRAGSYVYATMNMIGNVSMSQFFVPGAREGTQLSQGVKTASDIYSKYQSNQGGLIVMVTTDGHTSPAIPSCCQPVGIVMEEIVGFGAPLLYDDDVTGNIEYARQSSISTNYQQKINPATTGFIQNREIMVKFFPMYANLSLASVPVNNFAESLTAATTISTGLPFTTTTGNPKHREYSFQYRLSNVSPAMFRTKSDFVLPYTSNFWVKSANTETETEFPISVLPGGAFQKQSITDWPPPQSVITDELFVRG